MESIKTYLFLKKGNVLYDLEVWLETVIIQREKLYGLFFTNYNLYLLYHGYFMSDFNLHYLQKIV